MMKCIDRNFFRSFCYSFGVALALVALFGMESAYAESAHLAGGHHGDVHELPHITTFIWSLKWYWINFIVYVGALGMMLRKPALRAFQQRCSRLAKHVASAREALHASSQELSKAKGKLSSLSAEVASMKENIVSETERECTMIVRAAHDRAIRIRERAKELRQVEEKMADKAIRKEIVTLAMSMAKEKLQAEINADTDRQYRKPSVDAAARLVQPELG